MFNKILGITESYKMPDVLMEKLLNKNERTQLFDSLMLEGESLTHDWFTEYFQTEHGDRDKLKQDYTPDCVCEIAAAICGNCETVADICAGTGGLTLKLWQKGINNFICTEYSSRAIPVLLTNLAIRNINAMVIHGDALTHETFNAYELVPGDKYSEIEIISNLENIQNYKVDKVIMNPPYSMKWSGDRPFFGYETPPKSRCDYAFVLDGLEKLKENGSITAVLPHGVLFRGGKEETVRKQLIENNLLNIIVGMPDKLFLNTDIPVAIINWQKDKQDDSVLVIDADKQFEKDGPKNIMKEDHIKTVLSAINLRTGIDKLSSVVDYKIIEKNDFNLNIPRYVDTFEPPPPIDIIKVTDELLEIDKKIKKLNKEIGEQTEQLFANDPTKEKELEALKRYWRIVNGTCKS